METRRSTISHRLARHAALFAALLLLLVSAWPAMARAQQPGGALEIVSLDYDAGGLLRVSYSLAGGESSVGTVTALLDGVPVSAAIAAPERRAPASVLIAVDTSGSMAGEPIVAAIDAGQRLIAGLLPEDRVATMSFASWPLVGTDFTHDHMLASQNLAVLGAEGETALFDAVEQAALLLEQQEPGRQRVLVLLSDGEDSTADAAARQRSIDRLIAAGAAAHVIALGSEVDHSYLDALASGTGGRRWDVADASTLVQLFEQLGTELSANYQAEIQLPPLAAGPHSLTLRVTVDGDALEASSGFEVDNSGLLTAAVGEPREDGVVVNVSSAAPDSALVLTASLGGETLPVTNGRVFIDAWEHRPGDAELVISAGTPGQTVAETVVPIVVPALEPEIEMRLDDSVSPPILRVEARMQGEQPVIAVRVGDQELTSPPGEAFEQALPGGGDVTVEVRAADGNVAWSESLFVPVEGGSLPLPVIGAGAGALAGAALLVLAFRRRSKRAVRERILVRARRPSEPRPVSAVERPLGQILLQPANGGVRTVELSRKPVTVGSDPSCDIVLDGEGVRALHSRIVASRPGEFRVRSMGGAAAVGARPEEQWAILGAGESIAIGEHVLTFEAAPAVDDADTTTPPSTQMTRHGAEARASAESLPEAAW